MIEHIKMLFMFVFGGVVSTVLCNLWKGKALLVVLIPLGIVFFDLLYADLTKERDKIDQIPHGH